MNSLNTSQEASQQLKTVMADFAESLHQTDEIHVSEEEAASIVQRLLEPIATVPNRLVPPSSVSLAPIYTYVDQIKKDINAAGQPRVVVPAFATHWALVVAHPEGQMLYHLVFAHPQQDMNSQKSNIDNGRIRFKSWDHDEPIANSKQVGTTRFGLEELKLLGTAMIKEFGNYHRVFWNCQTFTKCFLRVITENPYADFNEWTLADTSRLFVAAFKVGAPFPTTSKLVENRRAEKLVSQITHISNELSPTEQSHIAISAIYNGLKANETFDTGDGPMEDESDKPGFFQKIFDRLARYLGSPRAGNINNNAT